MLKFSKTTTGTTLFGLDVILILVVWPLVLWLCRPDFAALLTLPWDCRGLAYPAFDLLLLFAMGLYRREAILEAGQSLTRVPLVVGMGAGLTILTSQAQSRLISAAAAPSGRDQMMLFGLAAVSFTLCAFASRLVIDVLLRQHVLRRRLLIVGVGQRAWDLLHMLGREGGSLHDEVALVHHEQEQVDPRLQAERSDRIFCPTDFNIAAVAQRLDADLVIVAPDERRGMNLGRLLECKKAGFPVIQYLSFVEREIRRVDLKRMELSWLVYGGGFSFGALDRFLKRGFDLAVSSLVLLLTAPLIAAGHAGDPLRRPRAAAVPATARDPGRQDLLDPETAHHAGERRGAGCGLGDAARQPHHPGRQPAAPHADRRAAAIGERVARRDVVRRAAP